MFYCHYYTHQRVNCGLHSTISSTMPAPANIYRWFYHVFVFRRNFSSSFTRHVADISSTHIHTHTHLHMNTHTYTRTQRHILGEIRFEVFPMNSRKRQEKSQVKLIMKFHYWWRTVWNCRWVRSCCCCCCCFLFFFIFLLCFCCFVVVFWELKMWALTAKHRKNSLLGRKADGGVGGEGLIVEQVSQWIEPSRIKLEMHAKMFF